MYGPIFFAFFAAICYSIANAVVERKLTSYSPEVLTFWFCLLMTIMMAPIAITKIIKGGNTFNQPNSFWVWTAALSLVFLLADWCYFKAYNNGGSVVQISTILALIPVFSSIISIAAGGEIPTKNQKIGYILVAIGVYLVAKK